MKNGTDPDYLRLMTKMVDVVAHDVRNPLNNILLSTAQFKLDVLPDKEDTAFYIDIIERNCDRVNRLLEELIAIVHPPGLHPDTFDITELVRELLQDEGERLELKNLACTTALHEVVVARFDRAMMKKALFQILDNAIDASDAGTTIDIKVVQEGPDAFIIITDHGIGIPETILPHIYAPFYTHKERHKGLGLTIAGNIIEAHQGALEHIATGSGTEARIRIPLNM